MTRLEPDRDQIRAFVGALFRHADPGSFVSLRAFGHDRAWRTDLWRMMAIGVDHASLIDVAVAFARACANTPENVVFCPPVVTFRSGPGTAEANLANGLAISVECDKQPNQARDILEDLLGPATVIVASGGQWTVPETGEVQDKLHLHWRLAVPARTPEEHANLKLARRVAQQLVGSDGSAVPSVHPLRWPGSWHRKGQPRLTRIVGGDPERETVLADALMILRDTLGDIDDAPHRPGEPQADLDRIEAALLMIPNPDLSWDQWNRIGMATFAATGGRAEGLAFFDGWSAKSGKYDRATTGARWDHYHRSPPTRIGAGTLFHEAAVSWVDPMDDADVALWESIENATALQPIIKLKGGNRPEAAAAGISALAGAQFYQRGDKIVYIVRAPMKTAGGNTVLIPTITTVPIPYLKNELGKRASWQAFDGRSKNWKQVDVPNDIATRIATMPNEWEFPPIRGVIGTQTMRQDGTLLTEPGYDPETGCVLFNPPTMPALPASLTRDDAVKAVHAINRLFDEFPFSDTGSRSVALSLAMSAILRPALPVVPLHVVRAPEGGTGKSYMFDLVSLLAFGEPCPVLSRGQSPEETEKRLIGAALEGRTLIVIDNCNGELRSEFLCQAVERPIIKPRPLGTSVMPAIPNSFVCGANGNNIEIADDLVRRTLLCSLDADMEQPYMRNFRNDPAAAILADRGLYIAAVLTIARAYIVAGKPGRPPRLASFEAWSDLVRGSLLWLCQPDPVDTMSLLASVDPVRDRMVAAFTAITNAIPENPFGGPGEHIFTVPKLVEATKDDKALRDVLLAVTKPSKSDADAVSPESLGWWLRRHAGRVAGGHKLVRLETSAWLLTPRASEPPLEPGALGRGF
jgi:putative DNA primase/helicase